MAQLQITARNDMRLFPTGTITFLFTDIVGSTEMWERHSQQMSRMLARHDALVRDAIEEHGGIVFKTGGDAFCAAFAAAPQALRAAIQAQRALHAETWPVPLRVRMALHSGVAEQRNGDYFGIALNRISRLMALGHGGQILISQASVELLHDSLPPQCRLQNVGQHRLKGLLQPEQVFQLWHPDLPGEFPPLRSPNSPGVSGNLPGQLTSFIGRERELAEVRALLAHARLLTLSGSGGCGKTRLGLQAAMEGLDEDVEGAWFVELAALSDPALVPQAVAAALGIKESGGSSLTQMLADHLQSQAALLILDNCEHLMEASAFLADRLLRSCPRLRILATSREALGVPGEVIYRIPSLSLPPLGQALTRQNVAESEAVRLFVARATAAVPDFAVTDANAPAVASICWRLDGIPFAIELAAAKARIMTPQEIDARLEDRFRLLKNDSRAVPSRQQTLRAMMDWSYNLLTPQAQTLLARLAVFAGGWTLEAAEQVCGEEKGERETEKAAPELLSPFSILLLPEDVLDALAELTDKSLVTAETKGKATRYHLLETTRQYAGEILQASGQAEHARSRHLNYFLSVADEAEQHLEGAGQQAGLDRLEMEHDNMRIALAGCLSNPARAEAGLKLAGALSAFWEIRGYFEEGRAYLRQALEQEGAQARTASRAQALNRAGVFASLQGDHFQAHTLYSEALDIQRALENRREVAALLAGLGGIAGLHGDYAQAAALHEEALAIQRELEDKQGIACSLANLGIVAYRRSDYAQAFALYGQGLAIYRELEDKYNIATMLSNMGLLVVWQGEHTQARALYEEALALQRELGDKVGIAFSLLCLGNTAFHEDDVRSTRSLYVEALTMLRELGLKRGIAYAFELMAVLELADGRGRQAAYLWGAAEGLRASVGIPLPANEQAQHDQKVAEARLLLGEAALMEAWANGRAQSIEQAIACALQETPPAILSEQCRATCGEAVCR